MIKIHYLPNFYLLFFFIKNFLYQQSINSKEFTNLFIINCIYFPKTIVGGAPIIKILVVRAMTVSGKFFFAVDCTW